MDENIESKLHHVGSRKRHELTGLEIRLLVPTRSGWRAQVIGQGCDYIVNMDMETLNRKYRDLPDE